MSESPADVHRVEKVTLSKALAIKNRLASRLTQTRGHVALYNSVLEGHSGAASLDVRVEYQRYLDLQTALIRVKAIIQRANMPIVEEILQIGELKDQLKLLSELDTKSGSEPIMNNVVYNYVATFNKPEVVNMIRGLEAEIDRIQDRLNAHNATTQVEIETRVLELAR